MLVRLIPVGNPHAKILEELTAQLPEILGIKVRTLPSLPIPQSAYNHFRRQYNAETILNELSKIGVAKFIDKAVPTLFVTDADIYYDGLNFVFGLEDPAKSAAIISLARLRTEFYDQRPNQDLLIERVVKEAIHEIGHHIGLDHCDRPSCVMCFSPSVSDVDTKQNYFCSVCKNKASAKGVHIG